MEKIRGSPGSSTTQPWSILSQHTMSQPLSMDISDPRTTQSDREVFSSHACPATTPDTTSSSSLSIILNATIDLDTDHFQPDILELADHLVQVIKHDTSPPTSDHGPVQKPDDSLLTVEIDEDLLLQASSIPVSDINLGILDTFEETNGRVECY